MLDALASEAPEATAPHSVVRESATSPYSTDRAQVETFATESRPIQGTEPLQRIESVDKSALAAVCQRHHIRWLAIFGSFARGDARPDSDVDVVVEFVPDRTPGFGLLRVAEALRPLFGGRRVDLLTRRGLSPRLRGPILNSASTLYVAP